jgi:hypothetical protein
MFGKHFAFDLTEDACVAGLQDYLGVRSRADLAVDERARMKFERLLTQFEKER